MMPYRIELSEEAQYDLVDIGHYTYARYGLEQMDRYLGALDEGMQLLLGNPNIGHMHRALPPEYRLWQVNQHYLIYLIEGDVIYVIRIVSVKRNLKQLPM